MKVCSYIHGRSGTPAPTNVVYIWFNKSTAGGRWRHPLHRQRSLCLLEFHYDKIHRLLRGVSSSLKNSGIALIFREPYIFRTRNVCYPYHISKIADFYFLSHLHQTPWQILDKVHFYIKINGKIRVLVRRIDRTSDKKLMSVASSNKSRQISDAPSRLYPQCV